MNKIVNFFGKPRTIENVIKNRKISWLELFYDLIFAVVFSRLTESLLEHQTLSGFINAILTFFWLIWGWSELSGYFDNHGNDSIINILIINIDMILIGLASIFIPEAVNGNFYHITWLYILLELLMGAVWIGLGIFDKTHGPAARVWGITHLVTAAIIACGLLFSNQILFWFLIIGTLINIFVVIFASSRLEREYEQTNMVHTIKDSLIERYGLMTMIALGEIISSLYDFIKAPINWNRIIQFTLCIVLVALLAAVYYQVLGELHIQLNSSIATSLTGWLFLLVILFAFLIGVSLHLVIIDGNLESKLLFSFSLILMLLMIRIIFLISIHFKLSNLEIKLSWILLAEMIINILAAFLPAIGMIILDILVLLIIAGQGRIILRK